MKKKKEKKKTPMGLLAVIVVAMLAVFIVQNLFPTNLGKVYGKYAETATEVTVTKVQGKTEGVSYHTDSAEAIMDFGQWASGIKMRNKSLADGVRAGSKELSKYNFAIKDSEGYYTGIVVDGDGFVHVGAELYKISGDAEQIMQEMEAQLESWKPAGKE